MSFFEKVKRVHKKFLLSVLLLYAFCLFAGLCRASNNHNTGTCLPVLSLKVQNKPLYSIIKEISEATGYDIKINERWKNAIVTATLSNVDIEEGLKIIFKKAGIKNHAFLMDVARKVIIIYTFPETESGQRKDLRHVGMCDPLKAETIPAPPEGILNLNRPEAKKTNGGAEAIQPPSKDILRARHAKDKSWNESDGNIPSPPEEILKMRNPYPKRRPKDKVTIPLPPEEILNKKADK